MQEWYILWVGKGVLFRERCPQFSSDLRFSTSTACTPNFGHHQTEFRTPSARMHFLSAMWDTPTVDSCSPRSDGKIKILTLLESVSGRNSGPAKFRLK